MAFFEKISLRFSGIFYVISGVAIFGMMIVSCMDIVLRLFRRSIPGVFEVVCFLSAIAVSFGLAQTALKGGHVAVSLFVDMLPEKAQAVILSIVSLLGFILFALISWQTWRYAKELWEHNEVSLTLALPLYPIAGGIALSSVGVCLILLIDLSNNLREAFSR